MLRWALPACFSIVLLSTPGGLGCDDPGGSGDGGDGRGDGDAGVGDDGGVVPDADQGPVQPACFQTGSPGEWIGKTACLDVYAECDGEPGHYLIVTDGPDRALDMDAMRLVKDAVEPDLFDLPGVDMVGLSLQCCSDTTNAACVVAHAMQNVALDIQTVTARLQQSACSEDACFGLVVEIPPPGQPRCDPGSPPCDPIPMCEQERCESGDQCCPVCRAYDPGRARKPAIGDIAPANLAYLEDPLYEQADECTHDGHCVLNGCGQYCSSFDDPRFISTCQCYPVLSTTHCGCVEGRCIWFYQ